MTEDGLILDERMQAKMNEVNRMQNELERIQGDRDRMVDEVMSCYDTYVMEPKRKKARKEGGNVES